MQTNTRTYTTEWAGSVAEKDASGVNEGETEASRLWFTPEADPAVSCL